MFGTLQTLHATFALHNTLYVHPQELRHQTRQPLIYRFQFINRQGQLDNDSVRRFQHALLTRLSATTSAQVGERQINGNNGTKRACSMTTTGLVEHSRLVLFDIYLHSGSYVAYC